LGYFSTVLNNLRVLKIMKKIFELKKWHNFGRVMDLLGLRLKADKYINTL